MIVGNVVVEDITLVESLKHNLLSVSQFTDKGFKIDFRKDICFIIFRKTGEFALMDL